MEVRAALNNYRASPQKVRLVADQIRGQDVEKALITLDLSAKGVAGPMAKLVRSAVANAEDKNNRDKAGIDIDNLYVRTITVDRGASIWRVRARAHGRAAWINKRTANITVVLAER